MSSHEIPFGRQRILLELRRLAARKMANEAAGHTLHPTALVHEAWMRLGGSAAQPFKIARISLVPPPRPCVAS